MSNTQPLTRRKHRSSSTLPPLRLKTVEKEVITMKDGVATVEKKQIQYVVEDEDESVNPLHLRLFLRETTMPCFSSKQRINKLYENELQINRNYEHITDTHKKWDNVYKMIDVYYYLFLYSFNRIIKEIEIKNGIQQVQWTIQLQR